MFSLRGYNRKESKQKAKEILNSVGLGKRINSRAIKLSGGEKQRCAIARAIARESRIILCDEPTGNLDQKTRKDIIKLLSEVGKDRLLIMVTHNFDEVKEVATRKITLKNGEIIENLILKTDIVNKSVVEKTNKRIGIINYFFIAFQNIFSSLNKTIILTGVLTTFLLATTLIFSIVNQHKESIYTKQEILNVEYVDSDEKRLVVMCQNDVIIENNKLKKYLDKAEYYEYNDHFYDIIFKIGDDDFEGENIQHFTDKFLYLKPYLPSDNEVVYGRTPQNDNEVMVGVAKGKYDLLSVAKYIDVTFNLKDGLNNYVVVGIYEYNNSPIKALSSSRELYDGILQMYIPHESREEMKRYVVSYLNSGFYPFFGIGFQLFQKKNEFKTQEVTYGASLDFKEIQFWNCDTIIYNRKVVNLERFELTETDFDYIKSYYPEVKMSFDTAYYILDNLDMRLSIFFNTKEECLEAINDLSNDYDLTYPADITRTSIDNNMLINYSVEIAGSLLGLFVIGLLSQYIVKLIMDTKKKDQTIFRSFGITKKGVLGINLLEIIYLSIFAFVFLVIAKATILSEIINLSIGFILFTLILLLSFAVIIKGNSKNLNEGIIFNSKGGSYFD